MIPRVAPRSEILGTTPSKARASGAARRATRGLIVSMVFAGLLPCRGHAAPVETLYAAFQAAYATNPTINAQRATVRIGVQDVALSATGYAPDISLNSDYGYRDRKGSAPGYPRTEVLSHPRGFGGTLTQNVWNGFKTTNSVARDGATLLSQRDRLSDTEQSILVDVASAYLDVIRDTAIVDIRQKNQDLLEARNKQAAYQFKIGQITKTDADQTTASLARSRADIAIAKFNLDTSRSVFRSIVGHEPGSLVRTGVPLALMPKTLDAAIAKAMKFNPSIRAARNAVTAAEINIDVQKAGYLPSLDLSMSADRRWEPDTYQPKTQLNQASVIGRLTVPLYDRGVTPVAVQRATEVRGQKLSELDRERATVRANVMQSWGLYTASDSIVRSAQAQIAANDRALLGVSLESSVGQRTTLDVLITQQALLDSRVSLETAEHDRIVAGFRLLALLSDMSLDTIRPQDLRYSSLSPPDSLPKLTRSLASNEEFLTTLTLRPSLDAPVR